MSRNINELHPRLQVKAAQLKEECEKQGIGILFGECFRTVAEQDALYAQGRTKPGSIVTNAKGSSYSSQHQWGIAVDFYLDMDVDGDGAKSDDAFNDSTKLFEKVGAIAKSIGLGWGGDWTSIKDMPHLYLPDWGSTTSKLKSQYGTPDNFKKTWGNANAGGNDAPSGSTSRNYLQIGDKGDAVKKMQQLLIAAGYSCGNSGADGVFGKNTETALKAFQKANGLSADGLYGEKSKAALEKSGQSATYTLKQFVSDVQKATGAKVDGIAGTETLSKTVTVSASINSKHAVVPAIQKRLNALGYNCGTADGIAGAKFTAAVKAFQKANGCVCDGEITAKKNTWKKLLGMN